MILPEVYITCLTFLQVKQKVNGALPEKEAGFVDFFFFVNVCYISQNISMRRKRVSCKDYTYISFYYIGEINQSCSYGH